MPLITLVAENIYEKFDEFVHVYENITNLQSAQESFLNAMGQG